jgi:hypothetical protein
MKKLDEPQGTTREPLDRILRELPPRRAPATLEIRVMHELERRAALPWWRRRFAHWPFVARAAFIALCGVIVGSTARGDLWDIAPARAVNEALSLTASWVHPLGTALRSAADLAGTFGGMIPPLWLYGFLSAAVLLYAALFGLGAAAYRSICRPSSYAGYPP